VNGARGARSAGARGGAAGGGLTGKEVGHDGGDGHHEGLDDGEGREHRHHELEEGPCVLPQPRDPVNAGRGRQGVNEVEGEGREGVGDREGHDPVGPVQPLPEEDLELVDKGREGRDGHEGQECRDEEEHGRTALHVVPPGPEAAVDPPGADAQPDRHAKAQPEGRQRARVGAEEAHRHPESLQEEPRRRHLPHGVSLRVDETRDPIRHGRAVGGPLERLHEGRNVAVHVDGGDVPSVVLVGADKVAAREGRAWGVEAACGWSGAGRRGGGAAGRRGGGAAGRRGGGAAGRRGNGRTG